MLKAGVTPPWLDRAEYPFASHWAAIDGARLHYLDEGEGPTVLMVHGTPTWSFLYRHLVRGLRDRARCVVPDHLGFGLSDKPAGADYRPADQARRLAALVERLGLTDVTLVVHDFGGPIGLAYALEHPENVRRVVLFNTWMWSLAGDRQLARVARLLGGRLGRVLYTRFSFSVNVVFRRALADRTRYTRAVHAQYAAPMRDPAARHATWIYLRELLGSSDWYDALWQRRDRLATTPALLVWGMRDPAFAKGLPRWRTVFRRAQVVAWDDVGHAPPEERGPESAAAIARFLDSRLAEGGMRDVKLHAGIPVKPVYGPEDLAGRDAAQDIGQPGEYPYTRGIHRHMYRDRLWTMRQYIGFGTPEETNGRFKYLMAHGQDALNVAFDLPTQLGLDSDDPRAEGEVGRVGMAIDTLADMEAAFDGIPLDRVSVSLTINGMAAPITAMYYAVAEKQGAAADRVVTTPQNDILKEFVARGPGSIRSSPRCAWSATSSSSRPVSSRAPIPSRCAATTSARPGAPRPRRWPTAWPSPPPTSR